MITGLNHVTLSVKDVEESFAFYTQVLGLRPIAKWPRGAYLLAGDTWIALVLDENVRESTLSEYTHIAFSVSGDDFERLSTHIKQSEAEIWQESWTEGASLYFVDPNGHKLEIHASDLETRIRMAKEAPWCGLELFV